MTDAQWLLVAVALIYASDCVVWLPREAVAVVIPLRGRAFVRLASSWAGNDRGGFAFTTILPARAVFRCERGSFRMRDVDERTAFALRHTRRLHALATTLFLALFVVAPGVAVYFGFARVGLILIAALLLSNVVVAIAFFRAHARVDPDDRWHRRVHALVMTVATPSAIRAVDQVTRGVLREFDALAVAARLAGEDDPMLRRLLRELAHPPGGLPRDARYEAARAAGLHHVDAAPRAAGGASTYCPRCLAQYSGGHAVCADCGLSLQPLRG